MLISFTEKDINILVPNRLIFITLESLFTELFWGFNFQNANLLKAYPGTGKISIDEKRNISQHHLR